MRSLEREEGRGQDVRRLDFLLVHDRFLKLCSQEHARRAIVMTFVGYYQRKEEFFFKN